MHVRRMVPSQNDKERSSESSSSSRNMTRNPDLARKVLVMEPFSEVKEL